MIEEHDNVLDDRGLLDADTYANWASSNVMHAWNTASDSMSNWHLASAQVYATLALAAATREAADVAREDDEMWPVNVGKDEGICDCPDCVVERAAEWEAGRARRAARLQGKVCDECQASLDDEDPDHATLAFIKWRKYLCAPCHLVVRGGQG